MPDENIRAYVENGAEMLRWMQANAPVQYISFPYPDYHAENPGGSPTGYRTHLPLPMAKKYTDPSIRTLRHPSPAASLFGTIASAFAIAQTQANLEFFLNGSMAKVLTLSAVVIFLMIRPQGLFANKVRR